MEKIVNTIIMSLLSLITFYNTTELPQSEKVDQESTYKVVSTAIDIEIEDVEEIKPKELPVTVQPAPTSNWWNYPSDIKQTTRSGNDLLVLVNKEYKLPSTYAPSDLVKVGEDVIRRGDNYYLRSILINDLKTLYTDAKGNGIDLSIVSAYRSYKTQESTYSYWVSYNGGCVPCADRVSARAGHSQHQLGTTLDFSSSEVNDSLGIKFGDTKASAWLKENAHKYGFVISFPKGYESVTGFSYEPWHYRYIGKEGAQEMRNSGMILEIYLRSKN